MHTIRQKSAVFAAGILLIAGLPCGRVAAEEPWVVFDGYEGPGKGKHIVLLAGDDEYRSEELIPQLAKILAVRHGFKCTVLFAINKEDGTIDPTTKENIPGLEFLKGADLMVMFLRFRELPDEKMKLLMDYTNSGKPIIALRTSTHPFNYTEHKDSPYAKYSFQSRDPRGGYGRLVFGETWVNHYGQHQRESTRGLIAKGMENHPIVRGIQDGDIWGPSDVYGLTTLHGDCKPVVMGQVLVGMNQDDKPRADRELVPVAWTKTYTGDAGKAARIFVTTMGHAGDLKNEGFRRLLVNACYWCVGLEDKTPAKSNVDLVGEYDPNPIGMNGHKKGLKLSDHEIR